MNTSDTQSEKKKNLPPGENKPVPVDDPTWNSSVLKPGIMQFRNTEIKIEIGTLSPSDMEFGEKIPTS